MKSIGYLGLSILLLLNFTMTILAYAFLKVEIPTLVYIIFGVGTLFFVIGSEK